jgi:DNA anti-recombination protein RmuC
MEAMRVNWTDDRLGERFDRIDERFDHVEERFDQVDQRFKQVDHRFDRVETDLRELRVDVKGGFDGVNARFEAMQRTLFLAAAGVIASLIGLIATQL